MSSPGHKTQIQRDEAVVQSRSSLQRKIALMIQFLKCPWCHLTEAPHTIHSQSSRRWHSPHCGDRSSRGQDQSSSSVSGTVSRESSLPAFSESWSNNDARCFSDCTRLSSLLSLLQVQIRFVSVFVFRTYKGGQICKAADIGNVIVLIRIRRRKDVKGIKHHFKIVVHFQTSIFSKS